VNIEDNTIRAISAVLGISFYLLGGALAGTASVLLGHSFWVGPLLVYAYVTVRIGDSL
jgi:hypothetical protein